MGERRVAEIIGVIVREYYGEATWTMLKMFMESRQVNMDDYKEVLHAIREFFSGSAEAAQLILNKCMAMEECRVVLDVEGELYLE